MPVPTAASLDDAYVSQVLESPSNRSTLKAGVDGLAPGDPLGYEQAQLVGSSDALDDLFVSDAVGGHRRLEALLDDVEIDCPRIELDRDQVGLLGDEHRAAWLALAILDDPRQRERLDLTASAVKRSLSPAAQA